MCKVLKPAWCLACLACLALFGLVQLAGCHEHTPGKYPDGTVVRVIGTGCRGQVLNINNCNTKEYKVAVTDADGHGNDTKYFYEFEIELWSKPAGETHTCVCRTCQKAMKPTPTKKWSTTPSFRREEQEKK